MDKNKFLARRYESERLEMYKCPANKWTVGVGHNIEDRGISPAVSALMLEEDLAEAEAILIDRLEWFDGLSEVRRVVLIDMCFNMGWGKFSGFVNLFNACGMGEWRHAAYEMKNSKWFRQVGHRARELVAMMESGKWLHA